MMTHKPGQPCGCEGFKTIKCQCVCHTAKSNVRKLKEELKKAQKKKG